MKKEYIFIIISGILQGLLVFGGQVFLNLGLSLFQFSILTQFLVVLMLLPFVFSKKLRPKKGMNWLWLSYGLVTAITILLQYGALALKVPVAIVLLLLYTQPLWTIIISKIFLKEKITKIKIIALLLVLFGIIILINPFQITKINNFSGIIVSLGAGIGLSCWVIISSIISKKKNSKPITSKFLNGLFTFIFLLLFYPFLVYFIRDPKFTSFSFNLSLLIWFYLIVFVFFAEIVGIISLLKGLKKVPASDAGIIMLLEPVVGSLLAAIFLSQALTINIIVGGILILIANYVVIRKH